MKRFRWAVQVAAIALLSASPGSADVQEKVERPWGTQKWVGLAGFQFLKIGQGARAVAMGDAYTAVADDINAIFWNPAGLTGIRRMAWTANYTKWLVDSYLYSAAIAFNTRTARGGVLGASVVALRFPDIEETTISQPNGTGAGVSTGDIAIGVAYALQLTNKFSFASRVSWIHQTLHTQSVSTVSVDIGTLFYTGFKSLRLAMALKNYGPDKKIVDNKFFMPLYYNVATAAEVYGEKGGSAYLTVAGESAFATDYEMRAHLGAEMWLKNIIALRAGYKFNYDTDSYSLGLGLKHGLGGDRSVTIDVSYSDMGRFFDAPLRLSVGGMF